MPNAADPIRSLADDPFCQQAEEVAGLFARLVRLRAARVRLRVVRTAFIGVSLVVGGIAATVASVSAVHLLTSGLSGALAELDRDHPWVGQLSAGLLLLAVLALGAGLGYRLARRSSLREVFPEPEQDHEHDSEPRP